MISIGIDLTSRAVARRSSQTVFDFTSGSLPAGLNLTRNSDARFLNGSNQLQVAPPNTPRFETYSATGQSYLLLEDTRSNLMTHSEINTSDWSTSGATLTDLSLNALGEFHGVSVASGGANWHRCFRNVTCNAATSYAVQLFWDVGSSGKIVLQLKSNVTGMSTLAGGPAGSIASNSSAEGPITILEDAVINGGSTRMLQIHWVPATTGSYSIGIGPDSVTAGQTVIPLAIQIEQAASGSSYIPTTGSTQSRQADVLATTALSGIYDMSVNYADQGPVLVQGITVTPGVGLPIPSGRITSLQFEPA